MWSRAERKATKRDARLHYNYRQVLFIKLKYWEFLAILNYYSFRQREKQAQCVITRAHTVPECAYPLLWYAPVEQPNTVIIDVSRIKTNYIQVSEVLRSLNILAVRANKPPFFLVPPNNFSPSAPNPLSVFA